MIIVRFETFNDQAGIQIVDAVATATLRKTYRPNKKALENKAKISRHLQRLVALIDDIVVGTVQYYMDKNSLNIIGLGVHPDFHRNGVARELIRFMEKIARTEGVNCLRLHTVKQTGIVEIFKHLGFEIVVDKEDEFFESDIYPNLIDVEMTKQLAVVVAE